MRDRSKAPPSILFVPGYGPAASFVTADREALSARARLIEIVPRGRWGLAAFARDVARAIGSSRPAGAVLWFAAPTYGAITAAACREFGRASCRERVFVGV